MVLAVANLPDTDGTNRMDAPGEKILTEEEDTVLCIVDMMLKKSKNGLVCKSMINTALLDYGLPCIEYIDLAISEIESYGVKVYLR